LADLGKSIRALVDVQVMQRTLRENQIKSAIPYPVVRLGPESINELETSVLVSSRSRGRPFQELVQHLPAGFDRDDFGRSLPEGEVHEPAKATPDFQNPGTWSDQLRDVGLE